VFVWESRTAKAVARRGSTATFKTAPGL